MCNHTNILVFNTRRLISFLACPFSFLLHPSSSMSKRPNPSNNAPLIKRSCKLAGFWLAWQFPPTSETSGSSSSSSKTSLFITVNQPDERHGTLRAQTCLLSGTSEPLAQTSTSPETPESYAQTSSNLQHDAGAEAGYTKSQPEVEGPEQNTKPKRKRYTKNLVGNFSNHEV